MNTIVTTSKKKTSHGLHLVLTILTGGLWLPVWVWMAIWHASGVNKDRAVTRGAPAANPGPTSAPGEKKSTAQLWAEASPRKRAIVVAFLVALVLFVIAANL